MCSDPFPGQFGFHVSISAGQGWLVRVKEKDSIILLLMFLRSILQYNEDLRLLVIRKDTEFPVTFSTKGECSFWFDECMLYRGCSRCGNK